MKITDRIDKVEGIQTSLWDGNNMMLTVLYKKGEKLSALQARVTKELGDIGLLRAVEQVKYREFDPDRDIAPNMLLEQEISNGNSSRIWKMPGGKILKG